MYAECKAVDASHTVVSFDMQSNVMYLLSTQGSKCVNKFLCLYKLAKVLM